jgi:hypothetical protein
MVWAVSGAVGTRRHRLSSLCLCVRRAPARKVAKGQGEGARVRRRCRDGQEFGLDETCKVCRGEQWCPQQRIRSTCAHTRVVSCVNRH